MANKRDWTGGPRPRPRRPETAGEVTARLNIYSAKLAEIEQRVNIIEGNLRNAQSAIDDMRLSDKGLLHEAYQYRTVFEHFRDSGFKALVATFLKEIQTERRRLARLFQNEEDD